MSAYYNEIDPFAAAWLRRLIAAGKIAPGEVDERSIEDVSADDLAGFRQCHFFAGIGGWSLAVRQAGVPDDYPVWTGSCPCQPFSTAGTGKAMEDERHLWPDFARLIEERGPAIVFGEQVSNKAAGPWLDSVQADLEAMDYAFACISFPSASVGAPHIRDRAYWIAESAGFTADDIRMEYTDGLRQPGEPRCGNREAKGGADILSAAGGLADCDGNGRNKGRESEPKSGGYGAIGDGAAGGLGDTNCNPGRGDTGAIPGKEGSSDSERPEDWPVSDGHTTAGETSDSMPTNGYWGAPDWLFCRDAKWRPVESGSFPLADGVSSRVGVIRGYGNAIVVPQARIFIEAALDI